LGNRDLAALNAMKIKELEIANTANVDVPE
jgi:hypothetical protein